MTNETLNVDDLEVDADGILILPAMEFSDSGGVAVVDDQVFFKQYEQLLNEELVLEGRLVENQHQMAGVLGVELDDVD